MISLVRLNALKTASLRSSKTYAAARIQPIRMKESWSHSTNEPVKTAKDVDTDKAAFNVELSQEEINEMKKHQDEFGGEKVTERHKHAETYSKGFKDLKDKGRRTAEEQNRPEDYM